MPENQENKKFPFPYPTARMIIAIFACYAIANLAAMWNGETLPNWVLGALIALCVIIAAYTFLTGFIGFRARNRYAMEQEEIRREEGRRIMKEMAEEEEKRRQEAAGEK